ncbi:putative DNA-binding protein ESCAROLA-like [Capsicum annuum]|uniref:protein DETOXIFICATION 56 n=1 Tax=Capsicum annuum TaxID=4072 RepID=UPI001FB0A733|nr:protein DETOXIFICATION 56 [Capsicum annuum]KAF3627825.1 putative DNA-binding protein ESCAROLA-like [Capsicum annuum]
MTEAMTKKWPENLIQNAFLEMKLQSEIVLPLMVMNFTWFAKTAITTVFLGRLGELSLAGATLGFTFANVTGFSVLNGLSGAMEPICGQAFGAKNHKLLHKTLVMSVFLLLFVSIPISFLWLKVDKILIKFGQQEDIAMVAKKYLIYLLPDLVITSFLCPLKAYLSTQNVTIPIMIASALGVTLHIPINVLLSMTKGLEGVSMAYWVTDLLFTTLLAIYVVIGENRTRGKWNEGGWWEQGILDWIRFLKLCGPCCVTTCLEWWCYEILVLLTGRLPNAKQAVGVIAIVLNFDYLIYSIMLSLATCASIRVSNELGEDSPHAAYRTTCVSLGLSIIAGLFGGSVMVATRGIWGPLFSHDKVIIRGVKKIMLLMALIEVVNFPLAVCGGIVRGTARPWLGMYANISGFYLLAFPLGVILAFKVQLGLPGLLIGFMVGVVICLAFLLVLIIRIDWVGEANKAHILARN